MMIKITRLSLSAFLSLLLIVAPIYSYAVLPAIIATAASAAGRVLVANTIKKPTQSAMARAGMSILGLCKRDPRLCATIGFGVAGVISNLTTDEWEIEIGGEGDTTNNNDIDISIYQINTNDECYPVIFWNPDRRTAGKYSDYVSNKALNNYFDKSQATMYSHQYLDDLNDNADIYVFADSNAEQVFADYVSNNQLFIQQQCATVSMGWYKVYQYLGGVSYRDRDNTSPYARVGIAGHFALVKSPVPANKTYMDVDQFYNAMMQNLTSNDIKNIYNYDYSQHPNITINDSTTSGDTINNNMRAPSPNDKTVSPNLKKDIEDNKVNMDNVNDDNCTRDLNGTYTECIKSPTDPDPDPDQGCPIGTVLVNAKDCRPDNDDNQCPSPYTYNGQYCVKQDDPDEPQPQICSSTELTQKFCDWIDWTKKPPAKPVDTKIEVIDKSETITLDSNRYNFNVSCPSDQSIPISTPFGNKTLTLKYSSMCGFLLKMAPFNEAAAYIASAFIVTGIRPRSSGES